MRIRTCAHVACVSCIRARARPLYRKLYGQQVGKFLLKSRQIQTYLLLEAFNKVANGLVTFHVEDNVLL